MNIGEVDLAWESHIILSHRNSAKYRNYSDPGGSEYVSFLGVLNLPALILASLQSNSSTPSLTYCQLSER